MNVILYPNAKINLGLRVLEKRADGYHNLETVFLPVHEMRDILELVEAPEFSFTAYGRPYTLPGNDPERELCVRAWRLLEADFNLPPVAIHLYKQIPVGAGLGGGSSDAAFTLAGINRLFGLGLSESRLAGYAARLGSDCAFFCYNRPMCGRGRGDELTPVSAPTLQQILDPEQYRIRLVCPDIHVSTADAYGNIRPRQRTDRLEDLLLNPVETWKKNVCNDFEESVFRQYPRLAQLKEKLYAEGAVYAAMSGSGSTLFGIFRS